MTFFVKIYTSSSASLHTTNMDFVQLHIAIRLRDDLAYLALLSLSFRTGLLCCTLHYRSTWQNAILV